VSDDFGDRMKTYEPKGRLMPLLPVIARLDGKSFAGFTRKMDRPYDERMSDSMVAVTKHLVDESGARIGYTQSDEITLVLHSDTHDSQIYFDGKTQKLVSVLASMASVKFYSEIRKHFPNAGLPVFDCRVFSVPSKMEAANAILWREQDATKNAISMAAHHHFGHKATLNMTGKEKQEKLFQDAGVNFNDYPARFKRGTFVRRVLVDIELTTAEYAKIPEPHRPENRWVQRHRLVEIDMPKFSTVMNRVDVIFDGAEPCVVAPGP